MDKSLGIEFSPERQAIGKDPRFLVPRDLESIGHVRKPALQALRERCIDCSGGSSQKVRFCTAVACSAWPFRMGTDPWRAKREMSDEQKAVLRQRLEAGRLAKANTASLPDDLTV